MIAALWIKAGAVECFATSRPRLFSDEGTADILHPFGPEFNGDQAARVGSIIDLTSEMRFAGKPLSSACRLIRSSLGAV